MNRERARRWSPATRVERHCRPREGLGRVSGGRQGRRSRCRSLRCCARSEQIESCTHHEGEDLVWYAPHDANRSERTGSTFGSPKRRIITGDRRQGSRPGNR